ALGVSRGSPEPADRGWEAFGYTGSTDPRGADIAREKFEVVLRAIRGEGMARAAERPFMSDAAPGSDLPIEPPSPELIRRIWWGAGSRETAENTGRQGLNLMSSTLLTEATGASFGDLQAEQIERYRSAFREAGHTHAHASPSPAACSRSSLRRTAGCSACARATARTRSASSTGTAPPSAAPTPASPISSSRSCGPTPRSRRPTP